MAPNERMRTILRSIDEGEDSVVAAALGGPAFLTGFSALDLERIGVTWQRKHLAILYLTFPATIKRGESQKGDSPRSPR
jgi:hypothetical protein